MSVAVQIVLSEREADALLRAAEQGRSGWNPNPSVALQTADFKIIQAICRSRAES